MLSYPYFGNRNGGNAAIPVQVNSICFGRGWNHRAVAVAVAVAVQVKLDGVVAQLLLQM